jgi:hypothetical protein
MNVKVEPRKKRATKKEEEEKITHTNYEISVMLKHRLEL